MTYRLDRAFGLERRADRVLHQSRIDDAWNFGGKFVNGGYLQGVAAAAVGAVIDPSLDHLAVSTVFSSQVTPGPLDIDVDVARVGRRISSGIARLVQDGETRVSSLVTLGQLPHDLSGVKADLPMPDMPSMADCPDPRQSKESKALGEMADVLDMRFVPGRGFTPGRPTGDEMYVWLRFRDGRPLDTLALIAFSDIAPPLAFALGEFGWAPTLQMQVTTYAKPVGDTVLMRIHGRPYGGTMFGCEEVDLWDSRGTIVARGRQIAMPPQPTRDDHGKTGH
ncbi:thioesterase family protein [Cumulibacter soli]|uniref:thioesterase family protein n=1 Tax=Cumulibacter soli TaxID=2546344 RepID=UPI001419225B|nr:thioesterase family protein [Cumulibacter soli]